MSLVDRKRRALLQEFEHRLEDTLEQLPKSVRELAEERSVTERLAVTASWVTAGIGVIALGIYAGREIRSRYRFRRRTPYDFFSHSGDRFGDGDLSVGI